MTDVELLTFENELVKKAQMNRGTEVTADCLRFRSHTAPCVGAKSFSDAPCEICVGYAVQDQFTVGQEYGTIIRTESRFPGVKSTITGGSVENELTIEHSIALVRIKFN